MPNSTEIHAAGGAYGYKSSHGIWRLGSQPIRRDSAGAVKGALMAGVAAGGTALVLVATAVTGGSIDKTDSLPGDDAMGLNTKAIPAEYRDWVIQAGKLCADAPAALIAAQIEAESAWNPRAGSPRRPRDKPVHTCDVGDVEGRRGRRRRRRRVEPARRDHDPSPV